MTTDGGQRHPPAVQAWGTPTEPDPRSEPWGTPPPVTDGDSGTPAWGTPPPTPDTGLRAPSRAWLRSTAGKVVTAVAVAAVGLVAVGVAAGRPDDHPASAAAQPVAADDRLPLTT
jgi:hypothetical protein